MENECFECGSEIKDGVCAYCTGSVFSNDDVEYINACIKRSDINEFVFAQTKGGEMAIAITGKNEKTEIVDVPSDSECYAFIKPNNQVEPEGASK